MAKRRGSYGWLWFVFLVVILVGGYRVYRQLPPFEAGFHDAVVEAHVVDLKTGGPAIGACPVFPADNVWNTPIDKLPKDAQSDAYIQSIGPSRPLHPDFGPDNGIPYTLLPPGTDGVKINFDYADDSDPGKYPIPRDAPIEGNGDPNGDRHVIVVDPVHCMLFELYAAEKQPDGGWKAGSGAKYDLTSNDLRDDGKTSADAAGLPIFPGLVRYDEVKSGAIRHALRFTIPKTQSAYVWPARHKASSHHEKTLAPMGERFRLRGDFDISGFPKDDQVILQALKTYGMFLADNGGPMFISGVPDKRWSNSVLNELKQVTADKFEAVDETGLKVKSDSGRANAHLSR